jgi:hypothetical protein
MFPKIARFAWRYTSNVNPSPTRLPSQEADRFNFDTAIGNKMNMQAVLLVQFEYSNSAQLRERSKKDGQERVPSFCRLPKPYHLLKGVRPQIKLPFLSQGAARKEEGGLGLVHLGLLRLFGSRED